MSIEVRGLTKIYGAQKAIDDISFDVKKGEILGLLGPNGAGKTTTMKILTCYMPASSGSAIICGLEAGKHDADIKKKIGYLPEHNPLYGTMYVQEYLHFVAQIHKLSNKRARVSELISLVGLEREYKKKISALSKGYKQRIGLAQAMIHDPEVLILDEPISGLDPNQLIEIRSLISSLKKDKTIIFSSHILQEVESVSDKVVILDKGKIVADDKIASLSQQQTVGLTLQLELLSEISEEVLQSIEGISKVHKSGPKSYTLLTTDQRDVREHVFDKVVENGNKILGLEVQKKSLESVFKSFTQEENRK